MLSLLSPCISPILGGILTLALGSKTAWHGASLLSIYSLGFGLPFLIIGIDFDTITPLLKLILHHYSKLVYIISSLLLITIGVLILTNNLN